MSAESSSISPTAAFSRYRYDVFLSFRGEDTRLTFTDHLYHNLKDNGIHTYRDDNELRRGQDISSELIGAIRSSRIAVVVFSINYGNSRWCLQELVEIMECKRTKGQHVLPVFYHVDLSDQSGYYEEAFGQHERRFVTEEGKSEISRWKAALMEAAALPTSWRITPYDHEAVVVRKISSEVSNRLKHTLLDVPKFIVALDSRLPEMIEHMNLHQTDRVLFIGICGMGGIGKTILAKLLFNQLFRKFEGRSFVADIRQKSKLQPDGIVHLQEQLLSDVLKRGDANPNIGGRDMGINVIKERIRNTTVLIVLDDVDDWKQIEALAGDRDWFCPGSRVVITTRDPDLLNRIKVDSVYTVEALTEDESTQLFNHHSNERREEFAEISKSIIHYCKGLPLAVETIGPILRNRGMEEWKNEVEKLKKGPPIELQKKLKISFDSLVDDNDKEVFLHIACFFVGWHKDDAVCALNGCDLSAEIALSVLLKRSLVAINGENKVTMHDLIRDMGREVVRSESPKNPGKRSRLWAYPDILKTLQDNMGTNKVVGIMQRSSGLLPEVKVKAEAFVKMQQLRLLCLENVHVYGNYGLLSRDLRWLQWRRFLLQSIPNNFDMGNLVSLDMQHSNLVTWRSRKVMKELKILDLSHSHSLIKTPDFSNLPGLEKLILEDCRELKYLDETIGGLERLCVVNLKDCRKLRSLPNSICRLRSLQVLNISGCVSIEQLTEEDFRGLTESLSEFHTDITWRSVTNNGLKPWWFRIRGIVSIVKSLGVYFRRREDFSRELQLTCSADSQVRPERKRSIDDVEVDGNQQCREVKSRRSNNW